MPVLTTNTLTRNSAPGSAAIIQVMIKVVNNETSKAVVYLTGLSNDTALQGLFAQELFEVNYREVVTKTYAIVNDFFQFNALYTQEQLQVQIFLIDLEGNWIPAELEPLAVSRITSEFRDNISVTADNFAAISFRRSPAIASPEAIAAGIRADGLDLLVSTPVRYMIVAGGTVNGAFVNYPTPATQIPVSQTALQVNYTCTAVTGGRVITQGLGSGIAGAYQNVSVDLNSQLLLYNLQEEPITLVISSLAGEDNVAATFRMSEQW